VSRESGPHPARGLIARVPRSLTGGVGAATHPLLCLSPRRVDRPKHVIPM